MNKKISWKELLVPVASVVLALLVGSVVLLLAHKDPMAAYAALFTGAFGSMAKLGDTISRSIPIIFTGLAVALAFRCGLFNIGAEGQLLVGGMAAALVGAKLADWPGLVLLPLVVLSGALAGGLWAAIPGFLKARAGVHEVINTIMMNYIAYSLAAFFIESLREGVVPKSPEIGEGATFNYISHYIASFSGSNINTGLFLALIASGLVYFMLWKTTAGYEVRAVGFSSSAAEYAGIKVTKNILLAMVLSGILAGLAGVERVCGIHHSFISGLSPGFGFEGIAVALLGRNHPLGVILASLVFGALASGGLYMDMMADVPSDIVVIIQATIIFFVAADLIVRSLIFRSARREVS